MYDQTAGDDDDLYAMLYGEDAPKSPPRAVPAPVPIKREAGLDNDAYQAQLAGVTEQSPEQQRQHQQQQHQLPRLSQSTAMQQLPGPPQPAPSPAIKEDDDEDEDFDVQLDAPQPAAQLRPRDDDDDLDIQLDEPISGPPPSLAQRSHPPAPTRQSSTGTAVIAPGSRPPPGAPSQTQPNPPGVSVRPGVAPPRPPPGAPPPVVAPPPMPGQWPRPQFVHTATGQSNIPRDESNAVLPSQAGPDQLVRLPGQTRVSPEEYKEFLGLGHGDVFDLDPDRVVQAPWRMPGADPADFFNYGLNINTWKEYVQQIHQFRLEFTMQKKIQTYDSNNDAPALDPDLPPELAAAVAKGRLQGAVNGAIGPPSSSQPFFRPQPPPPSRRPPQSAPKPNLETAIIVAGDGGNDRAHSSNGADAAADHLDSKSADHSNHKANGRGQNAEDDARSKAAAQASPSKEDSQAKSSSKPALNAVSGPKPPNGPAPPPGRPPNGPGFNRMSNGMHPMDVSMNGMNGMMMGMSGPMGGMSGPMGGMSGPMGGMSGPMGGPMHMFPPGFGPMGGPMGGPFPMGGPMMPMGGPMAGPMMPHPMMMGGMPGPMGPPFMPEFGPGNFGDFGDRGFMGGPGMPGGPSMRHFPADDQGPFREGDPGDDGVGSLAMGMDVDIPTVSTSGDRREADRHRGRESRYDEDESRRDRDRREDNDWSRGRRRDYLDEDRHKGGGRERDHSREGREPRRDDDGRPSWHDSSDHYDRHSRHR